MRAVDLHNHMPLFADYRGAPSTTPPDIVRAAIAAGVDVVAVTDHLSIDYVDRLRQAVDEHEAAVRHGRTACFPAWAAAGAGDAPIPVEACDAMRCGQERR